MTKQILKIKILEPILERDFERSVALVCENILKDKNLGVDYLQSLSNGEVLVAKIDDELVGVLTQRRPGGIFDELDDKYFALNQYKYKKAEIGFIVIVAIDKRYQGKGIGKQLVAKALDLQKEWSAKAVGVHAWQGSPGNGSQKLFESFQFEPLKMHKAPWLEHSKKVGPKGYWCPVCGNPCECDELEMIKYFE